MLGELFLALDMPEPPKESFFKGLFGGGIRSLDREELCKYYISQMIFLWLCRNLKKNVMKSYRINNKYK